MTPQPLFGAPQPQDTGGAIQANVGASARAAEMQVQAVAQAGQMVLSSLQSAMEMRNRRDSQIREIEAAQTLENLRQSREDARQKSSQEFQGAENQANRRAEFRRTRVQQRGENRRQNESLGFAREQASTQSSQWQQSFSEEKRRNDLLNEDTALRLRQAREQQDQIEKAKQYRQMAYDLAATGGFQRDPVTGAASFDPTAIAGMLQHYSQSPTLPLSPLEEAAQAPGAGAEVAQQFQSLYGGTPNQNAYQGASVQSDLLGQQARGGSLSGTGGPVIGKFDVPMGVLDKLAEQATAPSDKNVLAGILAAAKAGRGPQFQIGEGGGLQFSGGGLEGPQGARALELLQSLARTPGAAETIVGGAIAPMLPPSEQLKYGAGALGTGRAARPQAARTQPQGPAEEAAEPVQEAPAQERAETPAPQGTPMIPPKPYGTADEPRTSNRTREDLIRLEEVRNAAGASQYLAKYGVGGTAAAGAEARQPARVGAKQMRAGAQRGPAAAATSEQPRQRGFVTGDTVPNGPGQRRYMPWSDEDVDLELRREFGSDTIEKAAPGDLARERKRVREAHAQAIAEEDARIADAGDPNQKAAKALTERMSGELHDIKISATTFVGPDLDNTANAPKLQREVHRRTRARLAEIAREFGSYSREAQEFERLARKWGNL